MAAALTFISYTKISTFRRCRKKFAFAYVLKEARPPDVMNAAGLVGTAVHAALRTLTEGTAARFARNEIENYLRMPAHREIAGPDTEAYTRALEFFDRGVAICEGIQGRRSWAEKDCDVPVPAAGMQLKARVDRVDELLDGAWQVIDWKTGAEMDDLTDEQLDIAALAVRAHWKLPAATEVRSVAWNLRVNRPRERVLDREAAVAAVRKLEALARDMETTNDLGATPGSYCHYCEWRPRCPEGQEATSPAYDPLAALFDEDIAANAG